ncbi:transporter [Novosphingobium sp. PC22D]|uniref:RDD family protein n=1 Tax=Novosphingobium sp. PC22D TaxID=1962403 RepID=UPI000BF0B824|nr:RDD family protein [Novosphingobium sp. PC22D]PEQ14704.1 transporter [Novosphingobium sp. PC22D]
MQPFGGFWLRFVAYVIDSIILNVAMSALGSVLGLGMMMPMGFGTEWGGYVMGASLIGYVSVSFIGTWLYFALLECSSLQGTLGKKALGMVVTDLDGNRIGFGRATGRYFAKILSALILLIGYFMIGWTRRKQGLHDMLAGTLVYKAGATAATTTSASVFE